MKLIICSRCGSLNHYVYEDITKKMVLIYDHKDQRYKYKVEGEGVISYECMQCGENDVIEVEIPDKEDIERIVKLPNKERIKYVQEMINKGIYKIYN